MLQTAAVAAITAVFSEAITAASLSLSFYCVAVAAEAAAEVAADVVVSEVTAVLP